VTSGSKTVRAPNSPRGIRAVAEARKSRFVSADSVCHCRVRAATPSGARAPQLPDSARAPRQAGRAQVVQVPPGKASRPSPAEAPERKREPDEEWSLDL